MPAIEYVSYADATGYGQAAAGYVRLLFEAGYDVHWAPYLNEAIWSGRVGPVHAAREFAAGRAAMRMRGQAGRVNDLRALIDATARPLQADVRILHLMPQHWPAQLSSAAGVPHLGMTVWETESIPSAWLQSLGSVRHVALPSSHNLRVFEATRGLGATLPAASLVPHVCKGELRSPPPARLEALTTWAGIEPGDTVFYTINAWDPRKRMAQLVDGFARTFSRRDPAVLLVKTVRAALFDDPAGPPGTRDVATIVKTIVARAASEAGREPGRIALLAEDEMPDNLIDGIHAIGHCFVSLSRCEGFGLGGFDAASFGRPVIAVGYGGPTDYLGDDWPGRIPHRMVPCESVAGYPWFDPSQSWPEPDDRAAFALMREFAAKPQPFLAAAESIRRKIVSQFGSRAVSAQLSAAIAAARQASAAPGRA